MAVMSAAWRSQPSINTARSSSGAALAHQRRRCENWHGGAQHLPHSARGLKQRRQSAAASAGAGVYRR